MSSVTLGAGDSAHDHAQAATGFPFFMTPLVVACIFLLSASIIMHCLGLRNLASGTSPADVRGRNIALHAAHLTMSVSMVEMLIVMSGGRGLVPPAVWSVLFGASAGILALWLVIRQDMRPAAFLWEILLIELIAMTYMWVPTAQWIAPLSYSFAAVFLAIGLLWLSGILRDEDNPPHRSPKLAHAATAASRHGTLACLGRPERVAMAQACLVMAYMFLGMQLQG